MTNTPSFPVHHLPGFWAEWVATTAKRLGAPSDYVAAGLLGALAATVDGRIVARPVSDWAEPLDLWLCQVGGPWTRKSRSLDAAAALLPGDKAPPWRQDALASWLARAASRTAPLVAGGMRPGELAGAFARDEILAARFLFFWPERPAWQPLAGRAAAAQSPPLLARIAALAPPDGPRRSLPFNAEALSMFDAFCARLYEEIGEGDGPLAAWLARAPNTVAALALAVVLLEWSTNGAAEAPGTIAAGAVKRAIALFDEYFRPQAERVLARCGEGRRLMATERVVRWLDQNGVEAVTKDQIRRNALAQSLDAAGTSAVIAELEGRGVLVRLPAQSTGGRPPEKWRVQLAGCEKSKSPKVETGGGRRGAVVFDLPEIKTAHDLQPALCALGRQAAEGKLTPNECQKMSGLVKLHMAVIEVVDFEKRLKVLEEEDAKRDGRA